MTETDLDPDPGEETDPGPDQDPGDETDPGPGLDPGDGTDLETDLRETGTKNALTEDAMLGNAQTHKQSI